jgi:S-adenosylmethionine hydrolase
VSFRMQNAAPIGWNFMIFHIWWFFRKPNGTCLSVCKTQLSLGGFLWNVIFVDFFGSITKNVCPYAKLSSHLNEFYERRYLIIFFWKPNETCLSVCKTQLSLDEILWNVIFEDFFGNLTRNVCRYAKLSSHWKDFYEISYLRIFSET